MQLKEEKIPFPQSQTGEYYTSPFSFFSGIDPTRFEKRTPHIIFPRQKTAYREIFVLAENRLSKNRIGARFYDPELGVWLTPDPAGQFFNPYGYGGDPINYVDPDGEWIILAAISTYMLFKGVQNVAHHWDEISDDYGDGNWLQGTGKTIGVFGLGAVEGGVDVAALSYNYSPIGLVDRYSGLNIANDFIFAPIAGTLDYSSHALVYEEWDNADWSTAIREKAFWYRGGLGGFWGMMKTDFYNMQGEGRSFRGRYKRIQRKIDNCKQLRDKWEGAPPEEGTAERYQHGFSNSDFPRSEAKGVPGGSQMWHKFFGWTSSILGAETWLTSGMGGAKRHQYYGFEVYGESFEAWSEEDLRDDTQLDRFGYKPDWIDYHNSGCAELTGYGFWNR